MTLARVPKVPAALLWAAIAAAMSVSVGILLGGSPRTMLDIALVAGAALLIRWRPFECLIGILVVHAGLADSVFIDIMLAAGGTLALLLSAPRLPARRATVPLILLLLIALPSLHFHPSIYDGETPGDLTLPVLGIKYAGYPSSAALAWIRLVSILAAFGLAAWVVDGPRRLEWSVRAILLSSVVPIYDGLHQLATGHTVVRPGNPNDNLASIEGPFTHPNYFAFYLLVVLTLAIVVALERSSLRMRLAAIVLCGAAGACLVLTYTRSAWIGFGLVIVVLSLLRYRRLLLIGLAVIAIASFAFPGSVTKVERRLGDLTANSNNSWTWRTGEWSRMIHFGTEAPLAGHGFGSYQRLTVEEFGLENPDYPTIAATSGPATTALGFSAHNDYVKMFVEMGVPGVLLWVLALVGLLSSMWRLRRSPLVGQYAAALAALMIALLAISAADNLQGYSDVLLYTGAACGAVVGASGATRRQRSGEAPVTLALPQRPALALDRGGRGA